MIYILCGSLLVFIGILFLIKPAKQPNKIYGYVSVLAQTNVESFRYAQKVAGITNLIVGLVQVGLGILITELRWNNFFIIWLLTLPLFVLMQYVVTEAKLEKFLQQQNQLPGNYQKVDQRKKDYVKGFKEK